MGEFTRDLIFGKRAASQEVAADWNLFKLEQKLLYVIVRLSKVWTTVKKASNPHFEQMVVSLPEILTNLDQNVILLGQVFHNISYTRRFIALKQITGYPRKTKELVKQKNWIIVKETQLSFGERFKSNIVRTSRSKQKSKEFFSTNTIK